eukprot:jgi/Chlat1/4291/Chrsp29S04385
MDEDMEMEHVPSSVPTEEAPSAATLKHKERHYRKKDGDREDADGDGAGREETDAERHERHQRRREEKEKRREERRKHKDKDKDNDKDRHKDRHSRKDKHKDKEHRHKRKDGSTDVIAADGLKPDAGVPESPAVSAAWTEAENLAVVNGKHDGESLETRRDQRHVQERNGPTHDEHINRDLGREARANSRDCVERSRSASRDVVDEPAREVRARETSRERGERKRDRSRERSRERSRDRQDRSADPDRDGRREERGRGRPRERDDERLERDKSQDHGDKRSERKARDDISHRDKKRRPEAHDDSRKHQPSKEEVAVPQETPKDTLSAEEEQARVEAEIEKRRKRAAEWQRMRQQQEQEAAAAQATEEPEANRQQWSLEGEDEDAEGEAAAAAAADETAFDDARNFPSVVKQEDAGVADVFMTDDKATSQSKAAEAVPAAEPEDDVDPLDAFMAAEVLPEVARLKAAEKPAAPAVASVKSAPQAQSSRRDYFVAPPSNTAGSTKGAVVSEAQSDEDYATSESEQSEGEDEILKKLTKQSKMDKLVAVDHSTIKYEAFRKDFYVEARDIQRMTTEEVTEYRQELGGIKVRGKNCPKPIKTWSQAGLPSRVLDILKRNNFDKPMPIQAQAMPVIMSGRDCIGIAKTGSGKTLAFVLPMLRHIMDQPPLMQGDGPIGFIMAPTRELVQQIYFDIRRFAKVLNLTAVCVFGGSGIANQITDLKRGCEIVVCTPGRIIDILCTSGGKITNLRRVTYVVLDEADRMFDMGFEPQITRILQNMRPGKQTVMFSATFPRSVEVLARRALTAPVEIQIGGRSVVNKDIEQVVEVRPEDQRFLRVLELLGEWYEKGKVLIFVQTQEKCDTLFRELLKHGYGCLSLHGGKDQSDRESTIQDFKSNVCSLLIATSVAARGLDVKELRLVLNYDVPNHYEDYVHRVGRTGRAGNKGTSITFIAPDEDRYAPDLVQALELSGASVPEDLKKIADEFDKKRQAGLVHAHGSGYGGSGFKFDEQEEEARKQDRKILALEYGVALGTRDDEDSDEDDEVFKAGTLQEKAEKERLAAAAKAQSATPAPPPDSMEAKVAAARAMAERIAQQHAERAKTNANAPRIAQLQAQQVALQGILDSEGPVTQAAKAAAFAAMITVKAELGKLLEEPEGGHEAEVEVNDFPQHARWKVTHKDSLSQITEYTGAAITTRGQYYPTGKNPPPGERKLYLLIEGPTEISVTVAACHPTGCTDR